MVKNYKLALIGLLASCSLSNAMFRVLLTRFNRLNRLNAPISGSRFSGSRYRSTSTRSRSKRVKPKRETVAFVPLNPHVADHSCYYTEEEKETFGKYQPYASIEENNILKEGKLRQTIGDKAYKSKKRCSLLGYITFELSDYEKLNLQNNLTTIYNDTFIKPQTHSNRQQLALDKSKPTIVFNKNKDVGKIGPFKNLILPQLLEDRKNGDKELNDIFESNTRSKRSKPKKEWVVLLPSNPFYMRNRYDGFYYEYFEKYKKYEMPIDNKMTMEQKIKQAIGNKAYASREESKILGYCKFRLSNKQQTNLKKNLTKIFNGNNLSEKVSYLASNRPPIVFSEYSNIAEVGRLRDLNFNDLCNRRKEGDENMNGVFESNEKD